MDRVYALKKPVLTASLSDSFVSDEPRVSVSVLQEIIAIAENAIAVSILNFMFCFLSILLFLCLFSGEERLVEVFTGFSDVL